MKKIGILNCELSKIVAGLGHGQQLLVGDAAFPIPKSLECVDLALTEGKVSIEETLRVILIELKVEKVLVAEEIKKYAPEQLDLYIKIFKNVPKGIECVPVEEMLAIVPQANAAVRTGETVAYSSLILISGVTYGPNA